MRTGFVSAAVLLAAGCGRSDPPKAADPLAAEAAALPPGTVRVLPVNPAAVPADAAEARFEWAVLARLTPSPIVELNRAVAVTMAFGPQAGLEIVDTLISEPLLAGYHLLPSVRGDFLFRLSHFRA